MYLTMAVVFFFGGYLPGNAAVISYFEDMYLATADPKP